MNSSTSNFKYPRQVLLCTLLFAGVYALATLHLGPSKIMWVEQFQENQQKIENFLRVVQAEDPKGLSAVVGSSLGARLKPVYFKEPTLNLAFSGGSVLTGLDLILRTNAVFKRVYIDATLMRSRDLKLLSILDKPLQLWVTRHLPMFNIDRQPVALLSGVFFEDKPNLDPNIEPAKQFDVWLGVQVAENRVVTEKAVSQFQGWLKELKEQVLKIQKLGTEVVFVEMPMDTRVSSLPLMVYFTKSLRDTFSEGGVKWVIPQKNQPYKTMDSLHLFDYSANLVVQEIEETISASKSP